MNPLISKMQRMLNSIEGQKNGFVIATMYKFVPISDVDDLCVFLRSFCNNNNILGTLLIANEGLNGTISGSATSMIAYLEWISEEQRFRDLSIKFSHSKKQPFLRMKVRPKKEIVSMGFPGIIEEKKSGKYVEAKNWNKLIEDPDVMLVDTRNIYETAVGQFEGAIDPKTKNFRDFPEWARKLALKPKTQRPKKIAMYCTGGIRCEKATALMQNLGFDEVFHLKGGILQYLEDIPFKDSKWSGECFVFDDRVALDHSLKPGSYSLCHACRMPLSKNDREHIAYEIGVSCPNCKSTISQKRHKRLVERQKQIQLAKARGEVHLGAQLNKKNHLN